MNYSSYFIHGPLLTFAPPLNGTILVHYIIRSVVLTGKVTKYQADGKMIYFYVVMGESYERSGTVIGDQVGY